MRSGQSLGRKITLTFETVYNIINMVFAWFSIVSLYLSPILSVVFSSHHLGQFLPVLRKL